MEFFLSEVIGNPVLNQSKEKIGVVHDLLAVDINKLHPRVRGIVVKRGKKKESAFIPEHDIDIISPKLVRLSTDVVDLTPFIQKNDEVMLAKDFYDKQIVDIDDRRLTRVNDLLLESQHRVIRIKGVDISFAAILSRLGTPNFGKVFKHNIVDWEDVQLLGGQTKVKFNIQYKNLESLHPTEIARLIFEGPGYKQGSKVLESLKDPIAADIIEQLSPALQRNLIESMNIDEVADVIEHMPPYKAADLLVALGSEYSHKVLPMIAEIHANKIQTLLNYPENTTGAFMMTDYLAVPSNISVEQALGRIRERATLPDFTSYVYVLENEMSNKLVGIFGLDDLLHADSRSRIDSVMTKKIIFAYPNDLIRESLKKMYRYNISALPVVSRSEFKLLGIVTFRDASSIFIPKRWKVRHRQLFTNNTDMV